MKKTKITLIITCLTFFIFGISLIMPNEAFSIVEDEGTVKICDGSPAKCNVTVETEEHGDVTVESVKDPDSPAVEYPEDY